MAERLIIRRFTRDDWRGLQELGRDKESSDGAIYDHAWPTSEKGARGMAGWCAKQKECLAACLKSDGRLIGLVRFNGIDEEGRMDLGHMFHTAYRGRGYDTEALRHAVDVAFANPKVRSVIGHNAVDWKGQLTPLIELGFREIGRGKGSFAKDDQGKPIEFVGCTMELKREEWLRRAGKGQQ
jgi:RimJ/RimL family protein N-acetyltransferase